MGSVNILPESRAKVTRGAVAVFHPLARKRINFVPVYCANCGDPGPLVPEDSTFSFYLCDAKCAPLWGDFAGTWTEPDAAFFEKVRLAQIEKYGRELTIPEVIMELENENSVLSKLATERPRFAAQT
jgi:hypothetical protein